MHAWWPPKARGAWQGLAETRKRRARPLLHWLLHEFDGMVLDQDELLISVERRDRLPRGPLIETLRALTRAGLIRRRRIGGRVVLWLPEHLLPPEGR